MRPTYYCMPSCFFLSAKESDRYERRRKLRLEVNAMNKNIKIYVSKILLITEYIKMCIYIHIRIYIGPPDCCMIFYLFRR